MNINFRVLNIVCCIAPFSKIGWIVVSKKEGKKHINRCAAGFAPHRQTVRPLRKGLLREMAALNNFNDETASAGYNW